MTKTKRRHPERDFTPTHPNAGNSQWATFIDGVPPPEINRPLPSNSQDNNPVSTATGGPRPATGFLKSSIAPSA